tara:strand:+ start:63 stop:1037 length:975 start_codon:yes stop_codon:yes gene_type:complete
MNKKNTLKLYSEKKKQLLNLFKSNNIKGLYEPMHYIFNSGGKNIRPFFLILIYKYYGGKGASINYIALAIQTLHNFTLIHDDIMDESVKRRGQLTVHKKWDINTAILSGDALMIYSYNLLCSARFGQEKKIFQLFSKTAINICEGQQIDMDFQKKQKVHVEDYINMINLKTGALFSFAFKIGPMLMGFSQKEQKKMCDLGVLLGQLFQIQDDYLDLYGGRKVGKQKGLDVFDAKKTYLVVIFYEIASNLDIKIFETIFYSKNNFSKKLSVVENLFEKYDIKERVRIKIRELRKKIDLIINKAIFSESRKKQLKNYIKLLSNRDC